MSIASHKFRYIGKPLTRKEDHRLLTGCGRFSDDFHLPAQLYAAVVRSPHAHARINGIDTSAATRSAGVHLIVTGKDIAADGLAAIDHSPLPKTKYDLKLRGPNDTDVFVGPHVVLPEDKVRHVGEAVAMVVADTQAQAIEAAEKINVEYDTLPAVVGIHRALDAGDTPVWDEAPDNVFVDCTFGDAAATEQAFASATHIISDKFQIQRVTGVPLEPRSALGEFDADSARYTLHAGSGGAVKQKNEIAKVLGVDVDALRVLSFDVGGNFGTRNRTYVEFVLVLYAAEKLRRPVKYTASRSEAFLSDYQGRDFLSTISLALDRDGKFLALKADNISNGGARCVSLSPLGKGSALITGSYDIPVASLRARAVFTNTVPTQAYRSSGRPEVTYVIEQLVDKAARELGFDPTVLRMQNMVPESAMPYRNAVGVRYDSGDYFGNMRKLLELSDSAGFAERQRDAQTRGRLLGFGFANYVESSVGAPKERADLIVNSSGDITLVVGTQPSGQGHETSFSQVTADLLQIDINVITVVLSDTDIVSLGGGSHSGRSMRHAGLVIGRATNDLIELARERTAELLEVNVNAIEYSGGHCGVPGTDLSRSLAQIAASTPQAELRVRHTTEMHDPVFPCGAAACEVEIDPDTGATQITRYASVDDVGRCINPLIVHGQTHGAIVQGIGQAYGEEIVIDPDTGQTWSGSFMDYRMPRATDLPMFDTAIVETISPTNPLGIKSGGEGGTTPALSAFVSAVTNAIAPWHPEPLEMPVTPQAIWRVLKHYRAQAEST